MESERAREVQRMVEQLESLAEERILQGQADASRLRALADDMARREAIRIERETMHQTLNSIISAIAIDKHNEMESVPAHGQLGPLLLHTSQFYPGGIFGGIE